MRGAYLVAYDIADPARWRRVYRVLHGHGDPIQLSIFICWLSATEQKLLEERLVSILNLKDDRLLFVNIGARQAMDKSVVQMGKPRTPLDAPPRWYVV